ncbi:50S ribosomal subunit protein L24 [Candidatus Desulfarcum epimagneticum]|uniref:Large ribosomal subunit protein uL24 n=1 Tax=uncultured Desulfobacteraceae bacterium TaxID=218296 RepID=A0A484HK19_9BACT|nr:50S ribosomal subunit protein L24 [uncultured Desulfobacteraceae bacterium]
MFHNSTYHIKKDDKVKILTGKDSGKIGKVLKVIKKKDSALVEKINIVKRHSKSRAKDRPGEIVEIEAPIHLSNIMLMCDKCMKPSRVKMLRLEDGKKKRVCKNCDEIIDK